MTKSAQELEIKVAFLEDSLNKLSDEFYLQQKELDQLKGQYQALMSKLTSISEDRSEAVEIVNERPPHY